MKVSLPTALENFVSDQVTSGEFGDVSEVVSEALRLLRKEQETKAIEEMQAAFVGVDSLGSKGEATALDRAFIQKIIHNRRSGMRRA